MKKALSFFLLLVCVVAVNALDTGNSYAEETMTIVNNTGQEVSLKFEIQVRSPEVCVWWGYDLLRDENYTVKNHGSRLLALIGDRCYPISFKPGTFTLEDLIKDVEEVPFL